MTTSRDGEESAAKAGLALSWDAFLSTYLPALVLALGTGIALPAIPTLAKSFDVGFGLASSVVTSFLIGSLAGTIPSGWLIDRFGSRPVLVAGPLLTAVIALAVGFAHTFPELVVLRFFNGWATQLWLMARVATISYSAAPSQRGRLVSWMFGMDHTGKIAGPAVGGLIAAGWGMQAPFFAYAGFALIAAVPTFLYAQGAPPRERRGGPAIPAMTRLLSLGEIVWSRFVYFGVALFAGLARGPVQADLLHLYAAFAYQLGPKQIGYLATAGIVISWPVGFLAGWMMDRFGRKRTMVPGFIGVAAAMTALAFSAFAQLSFAWYVTLFLLAMMVQGLTSGSIQTVGADVAPPQARGTFLGLWRFTGQGGSTLSPALFALLAAQLNYGASFLFVAGSSAIVALLLVRYVPETRTDH